MSNSNGASRHLEYKGVFPANPTPVKLDGSIHEEALRAIFEDNMSHGVHGFWVAGSTGEGPILSEEQREAVARVAGETCQGRALTIMHVGAISTESAVKGAKAAKKYGCDAVCCIPPFLFRPGERAILDHYKAVADAADGLPFFVYNLPQLTQVETVPALMEKIVANVPNVMGLKHSAPNFSDIRPFTDMGLKVFSGSGYLPLPALAMGAVGTVDAPLSLAPWAYVDLFNAWEAGDMERAKARQHEVKTYIDLVRMFGAGSHVCKTVLGARLGIDCGASIPPVNRLTDHEKQEVLAAAEKAGVLKAPAPAAV
ncbi:MAG: dihydrodipicolinate synthase family protein [Dehalococcoidia bacterium]